MAKLVSKIYGDALFSLAIEENKLDEIRDEAMAVYTAVTENPDFISTLCHPEMTQEKKQTVLDGIFKARMSKDMMGFLHVLVKKGRFNEILSVLEYFEERAKEYKKIGVVSVATPTELTDSQKEQVETRILEVSEYETLEMDYQIDKELLGGIVIRIGDRVLDNSIRSKMNAMSRQLNKVKLSS